MLILNFTHPLTPDHLAQIEALTGQPAAEVRRVPAQFDNEQPFAPQATALADACNLTPQEWQTTPILINPPGYAPATAALLAELHGRTGHFPAVLRLRPVAESVPIRYEVAEVLDLQGGREAARKKR